MSRMHVSTRSPIVLSSALGFNIAGLFSSQLVSVAAAESPPCTIPSTSVLITPQAADPSSTFGRAVAIDGDWIAIGVRGNATHAGRVEIFHRSGDAWLPHEIIAPVDGAANDLFGYSLSMRSDTLLVGARRGTGATPTSGAGYVFRLIDGAWQQEAKLFIADGQANDDFGWEVALDGDKALIGAPGRDDIGSGSGAAYVFAHQKTGAWELAATLLADDGAAGDQFGQTVEMDGGIAAVGVPLDDGGGSSLSGSVRIFEEMDGKWTQTAHLTPLDSPYPELDGLFGQTLALRGGTLLVNAGFGGGALRALLAYERLGDTWTGPRIAFSTGGAVVFDQTLMVGPTGDVAAYATPLDFEGAPGPSVAILQRDAAGWYDEQHVSRPTDVANVGSVAFDGANLVAGGSGKAFVAQLPPRDRDQDGLDDECEIASGLSDDCDGDGVIDDVQLPYRYMADRQDGLWFLVFSSPGYVLMMNHFAVTGAADTVDSIGLAALNFATEAPIAQVTVVVYLDPDGDGHPADAVLLSAQPVNPCPYVPGGFDDVRIVPVEVGPPGTSFFVGILVQVDAVQPFAGLDLELPHRQTSWYVASFEPIDLMDLSVNVPMPLDFNGGQAQPWVARIRAHLSDCDGSNRLDACEIAEGALADLDGDAWPDVCQAPAADLDGDGSVGGADLGMLLAAWGPCASPPAGCAADFNGDGVVDGGDLGLFLGTSCE